MNPLWIVVPILLLISVASALRRSRKRRLARVRAQWGTRVERARRLDAIAASHADRIEAFSRGGSLDERTWVDLNLDDVFAEIDRTQSTLGQHALYHRLRTAPLAEHPGAFEALVQRMAGDAAARERAQTALGRLQDPLGYDVWWLARAGAVERRPWYAVFPVLTATAMALAVLVPFWSGAVIPILIVLVVNVVLRFATDSRFGEIVRSLRQCAPIIATGGSLSFLADADADAIAGPLGADVAALARLKVISRWTSGDPFMLPVNADPLFFVVSDVVTVAYEYLNLAFMLDATGVYFAARDLSRHGEALARVAAASGDVDAAISVASFRAGRTDWSRPVLHGRGATAELADLRHPLVDEAVPNSIALRPGRGVLVTGSNMSGKSTFLRTVGVNAILAQTIGTCLARDYRAPVFHVRSCIGRADDFLAGKSYYIVEVEALLGLVRASQASAPHLFLLDELFRGTNTVERIAAGQAVLQELLRASPGATTPHVVLAATHDRELVDLTAGTFDAYHFGDSIGVEGLTFDHRLRAGPATSRNALALLRLHGAPETVLTQAAATAEMLDRQRGTIA